MINTPGETVQTRPMPDRTALRNGLLETQAAFHRLLNSVPTDRWPQKSPGSDWSVAEVFVHLCWALEYLPQEVARARQGKGMFNMPKWLADSFSYWYIRLLARKSTPESVR